MTDAEDASSQAAPGRDPDDEVDTLPTTAASGGLGSADLPRVVHDYPAAVLLVDTSAQQVTFANDLALQLAPDVVLPVAVEEWSRAAGLQVVGGGSLAASSSTLSQIALGQPLAGREVSALLGSQASEVREALWVIGLPLLDAPEPLRSRSLLVLLPLRFPDAVADVQEAAARVGARRAVLASDLALAMSDPNAEDDPLVWVSDGFERITGYRRADVLGRNCRFLQGPDTDPATLEHLRRGMASGATTSATLLNHRADGTAFYNHLTISPVVDAAGRLTHRIGVLTDVTQRVLGEQERGAAAAQVRRARRAQHAAERSDASGRVLLALSEALAATATAADVAAVVDEVVRAEVGATGSGLALLSPRGDALEYTTMDSLPAGTDLSWRTRRLDEDLPTARAARTREAVFHDDRASVLAAHPGLAASATLPDFGASAYLPLVVTGELVGALALTWPDDRVLDPAERAVLLALARYTATAIQRANLAADRRSAAEVLQTSLLTVLPEPDHLEIRARYVPAARQEQIGGDWYDAVVLPDGATTIAVGDVAGHNMTAAAQMGQLRGLLRAFAWDREEPPSDIVGRLDRAVLGFGIGALATLVLARIEQEPADAGAGLRTLRWTNAGHPPPLLARADGHVEVLTSVPELLVGLLDDAARSDHTVELPPGSTLVLYTDGLIEHRGRSLDEGLDALRAAISAHHAQPLADLLDALVTELIGTDPEDDCALLAIRLHPEDRARPAEAGPRHVP